MFARNRAGDDDAEGVASHNRRRGFLVPKEVRPASMEIADGLVLRQEDVEKTGTLRQGRPEYRIKRKLWYQGFEVPAGFIFDVHSLPRPIRIWQPERPMWWGPAAIHDWALESGLVSIKEANLLYLGAMRDLGVKPLHRGVAYAGVEIARHFFPDRITEIDPHNVELVEQHAGREAVFPEKRARVRKLIFGAIKMAAGGYLKSKGIGFL